MTAALEKMKVGKKASKPLMEKKRRARINKSLNQLKCLLENEYFSNVRKRKLEKADILELTVKHLRNLQTSERGSSAGSADYEAGYRRCLSGVSRYILSSEPGHEPRSIFLTRLTNTLSRPHVTNCPLLDSTSSQKTERQQNTPDKSFKNRSELKKQQTRQQMTSFRQCGGFPEAIKPNYWRPW